MHVFCVLGLHVFCVLGIVLVVANDSSTKDRIGAIVTIIFYIKI